MFIKTSIDIAASPGRVWPLLGRARLEGTCLLERWVPVPRECRLSEDGRARECLTSRGRIRQRVTRATPERELAFEMVSEDVGLSWLLTSMDDRFVVERVGALTRLTRVSRVQPRCAAAGWILRWAIPRIHRYVHARFKRLAETGA
ncbi:MAG TPA: SRPBCC family protein [Planctomycetota bacterium]